VISIAIVTTSLVTPFVWCNQRCGSGFDFNNNCKLNLLVR